MIIPTSTQDQVQVNGAMETSAFTIKASAKSFEILASNLYSNKMGAMIRELSTNAYDAHVMVGNQDKPFTIKVPTTLDPTFKIRDFGPGLSEEEIKTVYTTFFESTKTDSNDVVGCLGLGSKSPFGITDNFTINSYKDGTQYIYSAYLDSARIPTIAKFGEFPTDEPNGVEIEVAIKKEDINQVAREVNRQLKYFKVKPIIKGNSEFEWDLEETYAIEGTNWKLVNERYHSQSRVLQGQISYPIETDNMGNLDEVDPAVVEILYNLPIIIEVEIGEVNIAPSREALTYDEATISNLIKRAEAIKAEFTEIFKDSIKKAKTELEAKTIAYQTLSVLGYHSYLKKAIHEEQITWNDVVVTDDSIHIPEEVVIEASSFQKNYRKNWRKEKKYSYTLDHSRYNDKAPKFYHINITSISGGTTYFFANSSYKNIDAKIKKYMEDNNKTNSTAYLIKSDNKDFETFIKEYAKGIVFVDVEPLEKPTRKKSATKNTSGEVSVPYFYDTWSKTDKWSSTNTFADLNSTSGLCIDINRHDAFVDGRSVNPEGLIFLANKLGIMGDRDKLYGIRPSMKKRKHNFINIVDAIKEALNNQKDFKIVINKKGNIARFIDDIIDLDKNYVFSDPDFETLKNVIVASEEWGNLRNSVYTLETIFKDVLTIETSEELENKLMERYPILEDFSTYRSNTLKKEYLTYIELKYNSLQGEV